MEEKVGVLYSWIISLISWYAFLNKTFLPHDKMSYVQMQFGIFIFNNWKSNTIIHLPSNLAMERFLMVL